jgi:hypothetical protein
MEFEKSLKGCGGVLCRDLIGYDLTNPEELESARDSNVFMNKCIHFIEKAVEILIDLKRHAYTIFSSPEAILVFKILL